MWLNSAHASSQDPVCSYENGALACPVFSCFWHTLVWAARAVAVGHSRGLFLRTKAVVILPLRGSKGSCVTDVLILLTGPVCFVMILHVW
jgi:hypothetical protein